jgi:hypothetical protein
MRNTLHSNVDTMPVEIPPLTSVATFCRWIGRTPVTAWRWQQLGWIDKPVNIAGKPYLTQKTIEKFLKRAEAGDFAKAPHAPRKQKAEVLA